MHFLFLLIGLIDILIFVVYFIKGKSVGRNKIQRYFALAVMLLSIVLVFVVFSYYEKELHDEVSRLRDMTDSTNYRAERIDSILAQQKGRELLLDSLSKRNDELETILQNLQKHEKITGSKSGVVPQLQEYIKETKQEINKTKTYNEMLNPSEYWNAIKNGYTYSGNTTAFTFYPPYKTSENYIDFSIRFNNEEILEKIAVLFLEVYREDSDGKRYMVYSAFYRPQSGLNNFMIHNYLQQSNTTMMIGFFWKSELGKVETPSYEKYSYHF